AFQPVLWESNDDWDGHVEQVWFRGAHGDVGGQLAGYPEARPLTNIPLTWMLSRLEACELPLPENWRSRFPTDVDAPWVGTWRGWGKYFLARKKRVVGTDPSEAIHHTAKDRAEKYGLPVAPSEVGIATAV
ncbi:MAG: phospholipase effector Tle1 domain-containing protein, partial [Boseongicola sp.]